MSLVSPAFVGCTSTGGGGSIAILLDQPMAGAIDGANTVFLTASDFRVSDGAGPVVYYNGQRLHLGAGHDYVVSESGGVGTGYDTVTLAFAPRVGDHLSVDYVEA